MKLNANLGWALVAAVLAVLMGLGALFPSSESGPANAGRFVIGVWLAACLLLTLVAWVARGRWRALIIWTAAAPIWLWFAYILVAVFVWPDHDKGRTVFVVGIEVFLAAIASVITAIGVFFWRARPVDPVAKDPRQTDPT